MVIYMGFEEILHNPGNLESQTHVQDSMHPQETPNKAQTLTSG